MSERRQVNISPELGRISVHLLGAYQSTIEVHISPGQHLYQSQI
jgi:hypothetical protein